MGITPIGGAKQQNQILMARLRELGVDPAQLLDEIDGPIE